MSSVQAIVDGTQTAVDARIHDTTSNCHAVSAHQEATAGTGSALKAISYNTTAPAAVVQGGGDLLHLRNAAGVSKVTVDVNGAVTVGALTATSIAGTTLAGTGDLTVTSGNVVVATVGKGVTVKEGTNARMGTSTLNGATEVTIATTAVTATSRIFLTIQLPHGTPAGAIYVSSRSAGVSFGVKGLALDTSDFAWMIVEPS